MQQDIMRIMQIGTRTKYFPLILILLRNNFLGTLASLILLIAMVFSLLISCFLVLYFYI